MRFVFLHVGTDFRPSLMVRSIRKLLPDSEIIQCTNDISAKVEGIDRVHLMDGDVSNLMTYRLAAFADLGLKEPAAYLDTDILITSTFDINALLGDHEVAVCRRSFGNDSSFNPQFRGMNLSEYANKTLGQVYPYLACFNISRDNQFWSLCHQKLLQMDPKFHYWYGDQEAMREVLKGNDLDFCEIPEAEIACLPEHVRQDHPPKAIHFKGPTRKSLMTDVAHYLRIT